jgi:hypothetical protein
MLTHFMMNGDEIFQVLFCAHFDSKVIVHAEI